MISWSCDAAGEELDRSDEQPCSGRGDGLFEVLCEAAVAVQPGQCSLDNPAARENNEALCGIGPLDDFDGPFSDPAQRALELFASIAAIGEDVPQPREAFDDLGQHQRSAVTVLDVGGVDYGMDEIAVGVRQDMALAPLGLLARIVTPRPAAFCGFDALAVDHPSAGRGFTTGRFAPDQEQGMVQ